MQFPRLFTDPLDPSKATQVLHRIADRAFATPSVIYSVLYRADRELLSRGTSSLYGETYLAYHHAAVPSWANHVYMTLSVPSRDVGLYLELRRLFLINGEGWLINRDMSVRGDRGLGQAERDAIDDAVYWYRSASYREILISRRDASWQKTPHGQPIPDAELQRNGRPQIGKHTVVPDPKHMTFMGGLMTVQSFAPDELEFGAALA